MIIEEKEKDGPGGGGVSGLDASKLAGGDTGLAQKGGKGKDKFKGALAAKRGGKPVKKKKGAKGDSILAGMPV